MANTFLNRNMLLAMTAALAVGIAGCEKKETTPPTSGKNTAHHHDHDHDHDHDHGAETSLGKTTIGAHEVEVLIGGAIKAGEEAHATIKVASSTIKIAAVRAWIGKQDGAGAMKAKADAEEHGYHAHVEVPATIAADDKFWIEIEGEDAKTSTGSFEIKR